VYIIGYADGLVEIYNYRNGDLELTYEPIGKGRVADVVYHETKGKILLVVLLVLHEKGNDKVQLSWATYDRSDTGLKQNRGGTFNSY
jgi:hypothetical protein